MTAIDEDASGVRRRSTTRTAVVVGLAAYLVAALVVLLSPVSPEAIVAAVTAWLRDDVGLSAVRQGWIEFGANVAMFVPLGLLVTLAFRHAWWGVAAALIISAGAELAQVLLPGRLASPRDVVANVLGAGAGAAVIVAVRAIRRGRARRRR
jgi:hypothetical protein